MDIQNEETLFNFDELFFSRTNNSGVIISGNNVFQKISQFDWNELIEKAHSVVRHPDMPRGVFYLFWRFIKNGQPIGTYVKNRSKSGTFYWVYALAIPEEEYIISIRLKPSSPIFQIVQEEYKKLLELEKLKGISPSQSCDILEEDLKNLGFPKYTDFMTKALMEELLSREKALGRSVNKGTKILNNISEILNLGTKLHDKAMLITSSFKDSMLIPLNLIIQANKLKNEGNVIFVVAEKYTAIMKEIEEGIHTFETTRLSVEKALKNSQFVICASVLENEILEFFKRESSNTHINIETEKQLLNKIKEKGLKSAIFSLVEISLEFSSFRNICEKLTTMITALEFVRLTGKIEIARISKNRRELDHLIEELLKFKEFLEESIKEISHIGNIIQDNSNLIQSSLQSTST